MHPFISRCIQIFLTVVNKYTIPSQAVHPLHRNPINHGREVSRRLAARGFDLSISYLMPEEAESLEATLDVAEDRVMFRRCDCTDALATAAFVEETVERFGPINVLCCLVGGWSGGRANTRRSPAKPCGKMRQRFTTILAGISLNSLGSSPIAMGAGSSETRSQSSCAG